MDGASGESDDARCFHCEISLGEMGTIRYHLPSSYMIPFDGVINQVIGNKIHGWLSSM